MEEYLIEMDDPCNYERHPDHVKAFYSPEKKTKKENYHNSIETYGKAKPVFYVVEDGKKLVIDGWGFVVYARQMGYNRIPVKRIYADTPEARHRIMMELQVSDHNTPEQEHKIYAACFEVLNKGKGYRSDLDDVDGEVGGKTTKECTDNTGTNKKARRPTIFQNIADQTNAPSAKRVQYMLKIGKINPLYFWRMETERTSVYAAYLAVKNEEEELMPDPPTVKDVVIVKGAIPPVEFTMPDATIGPAPGVPLSLTQDINSDGLPTVVPSEETQQPIQEVVFDPKHFTEEYIMFEGECMSCGSATQFRVLKTNITWK